MSPRSSAFEVLKRVARVREIRATQELSVGLATEQAARQVHDSLQGIRAAVAVAGLNCMRADMDVPRYDLVSRLDHAVEVRLYAAKIELIEAQHQREEKMDQLVLTTRYHEKVSLRGSELETKRRSEHLAIQQDEAIELWLGREKRQ